MRVSRVLMLMVLLCGTLLPDLGSAQFTFTTNNGVVTITGYTGIGGAVFIPETTNGLPVRNIGSGAFSNKLTITSVAIPNNTTNLGANAFYLCTALTNISFGSGLLSISPGSFFGCKSLSSVTIPDTVRSLGSNVFNQCVSLTNVVIGNLVTNLGASLFQACSNLASVVIPNGVTNIGNNAFLYCTGLTNVALGGNLRSIGYGAFQGCVALSAINLPGGLTSLGSNVFSWCISLTNVVIGNAVANLDTSVFQACSNLASVVIPNGVTNIGNNAFFYCTGLTNVALGGNLRSIGYGAFQGCAALSTIDFPSSLTSLGICAFWGCSRLTSVNVPDTVTNLGVLAFAGCSGLQTAVVGNRVPTLSYTFDRCTSLQNVVIGTNVSRVETFYSCGNLKNILFPAALTNLSSVSFRYCTNLLAINIDPANRTYISLDGVVFDKAQTTLVKFPGGKPGSCNVGDNVTHFARGAFWECFSLTNLFIGSGVTNMEYLPFDGAMALQDINVNPLNPVYCSINGVLFDKKGTTLLRFPPGRTGASYVVPAGTTTLADDAFAFSGALTSVTVPASVTTVQDDVFAFCSKLVAVTFLGDAFLNYPSSIFLGNTQATAYYLPGTVGWTQLSLDFRKALWNPVMSSDDGYFGVRTNHLGFNITGTSNILLVVEASTNLSSWAPLQSVTLTNGSFYFIDLQWTNNPSRFYRLRSP